MSIPLIVDNNSYQYPSQGDKANTGWGGQTTSWASAVTSALTKLGLGGTLSPNANAVINIDSTSKGILIPRMTTVQRDAITSPTNSLLIFNTTLKVVQYYDSSVSTWISIGARLPDNAVFSGTLQVNGNITGLGSLTLSGGLQATTGNFTDTTDATDVDTAPLKTLGGMAVKKKLFVGTDITVGGVIVADDSTNVTTAPPISFTGDLNTGIGHSAADTLDLVTGGVSKTRISSTGLQSSVVPDLSGSNTTLFPEYKCRAWVNFNGNPSTPTIRKNGNITSVIKNTTGDYTINFLTAMPDADYSVVFGGSYSTVYTNYTQTSIITNLTTGSFKIFTRLDVAGQYDFSYIFLAVFR